MSKTEKEQLAALIKRAAEHNIVDRCAALEMVLLRLLEEK